MRHRNVKVSVVNSVAYLEKTWFKVSVFFWLHIGAGIYKGEWTVEKVPSSLKITSM
jgi:hypothetical protein